MPREYRVRITREYVTDVILKFPDDGRDHIVDIGDKIQSGDQGLWDLIAEKELEQMNIAHEDWVIDELNQQ